MITGKYKAIVDAQKAEISVSAEGYFGEMQKTDTPSKIRRIGWFAFTWSLSWKL